MFLTLLLTGSLLAVTGLRQFFLQPLADDGVNLVWFIVQILPLLLTLPGVLRMQVRSTFMLCLASLLYFVHGVLVVFDPPTRLLGAAEISFAMALCAVTAWMVRRLRELEAQAPPAA